MSSPPLDIQEHALRLLEPDAALPADWCSTGGARALAWALKDLCYESWNTDPPRAARAANALRRIVDAGVPGSEASEVGALADWAGGIAAIVRSEMNQAVQHFDAAATALNALGLPDPAAQTQVPKIMALSMLGQHALAAECALAAQRALVALGNLRAAARVSQNLGNLQLRRDDYAQAAQHYREAAVLFARMGDVAHSVSADIGLADALTAMGDFDEAQHMYERARMRAHNHGLDQPLALVDESMALVDLARGRYREALQGLDAARRRYVALALPHCAAIAEKQLGDAYLDLRLLPEALALFDAAVQRFAALEMPDEQAWALLQCGRTQALLGDAAASASLASAASLFADQGNRVGAAAIALVRAELALAGGALPAALEFAGAAIAAYAAAGQTDGLARAEVVQADALLRAGRIADARHAFEMTLDRACQLQQTQIRIRCHTGLGLVASALGDRTAAGAAFDAAIELFEVQRRALPGDDLRVAFLADHLRPYQERVRLALADGQPQDVLAELERCRGLALDEWRADAAAPELEAELRPLRERVHWLTQRVQRLEYEAADATAVWGELRRIEGELLERARRGRIAAGAANSGAQEQLDLAALRSALGAADALVAYGVLDDELFALIVTRDSVHLERQLASWAEVQEQVDATRFQIETLRHGTAHVGSHLAQLGARLSARLAQLHGLVWARLAPHLAQCQRLLIVPHAQLGALPFAALTDGTRTLGERFDLAITPSGRAALRGLAREAAPARRALALGETTRLPRTGAEARAVAMLFGGGEVLVDESASVERFCTAALRADVVHIACHATFRADNPRFSALHLHDGVLTVERIESLQLAPCTVVLSACETALAQAAAGDETIGLVRAFLAAGAARVLASLWSVDDTLTERFMTHFYDELVRGVGAAAALRSAQARTRAESTHPCAWAAFTLYGGW